MCKVYTGYCGTSEIEHGLCACTVDNPLAKARGLSLRTGAQPMLYLPYLTEIKPIMQMLNKGEEGAHSPNKNKLTLQDCIAIYFGDRR